MKVRVISSALFIFSALLGAPAHAAGDHAGHGHAHGMAAPAASGDMQLVDAQVKKVDKSAGKVTLAHGPLTNLNMPAMTMVFRVKDAAWIDQMKAGDKIRFQADSVNGAMTVVHLEPAK
jgi:Cu/Ag efflux protein CusF